MRPMRTAGLKPWPITKADCRGGNAALEIGDRHDEDQDCVEQRRGGPEAITGFENHPNPIALSLMASYARAYLLNHSIVRVHASWAVALL